jgi:hypothetical protein
MSAKQIQTQTNLFYFFHKSNYFELFYANLSVQQKCESSLEAAGAVAVMRDAKEHSIIDQALLV